MASRRFKSLKAVRIATLLFPPLGLVLLWLSSEIRLRTKVIGSFYIPCFAILHLSVILATLYTFFGYDFVEWRGGYIPAVTFSKTLPDYNKLEVSRARKPAPAKIPSTNGPTYWTGFRGPNRDGHYDEKSIPANWPAAGLRLLWRQPVGGGYASFAIAEGRAFTIEQRREQEVVAAYDVATGAELWTHGWSDKFEEPIAGEGPRATPAYDHGRIYALGGRGEFRCLDAMSGKLLWRRDIIIENAGVVMDYGVAASPLVVDDKVIVLPGGLNGKSVAAYDKISGALLWTSLHDKQAYASPMRVKLAGQDQLLILSARGATGILPEDGKVLWRATWEVQNDNVIAQPVIVGTNKFCLSGGYGKGCTEFEVSRDNTSFSAHLIWQNKYLKNKFSSSVYWNGYIYGLDEDILVCLDARTGERMWKDGRYGYGQILLAGGNLIVLSGTGELALVTATPAKYEERARFQAIHGKTWNHPAISDGNIFVRNAAEMACFDLESFP